MYLTLETTDGGSATVNLATVTHITQLENAYAEAGSVVHFVSDRSLQVKLSVEELTLLVEGRSETRRADDGASLLFAKPG